MSISIVRLGSPRAPAEGVRIGTVRRPPRGVPKSEFGSRNYYDVWLPILSPSPSLVADAKAAEDAAAWKAFTRKFRTEMEGDAGKVLDLLAVLSHTAHFSIGCYCEHEDHCHRGVLRQMLAERGASIV
ncbi:DUF488 domain-containing protein [Paraburkholderia megapolitana]|uniref:Uncharacterized conserved protein YeaO, DUF488 family n=1 Tax=Paraburkholderia megapolitana TaxID=420953 RepID=A0A1I3NWI1_9BURK|nr:DUF488 family protein [Paraburkholderia megapolitana]QDQ84518.1 DUF488 family protein [Paraburkholderia megapolitana]SFJ13370.1 Uncharacterized conserved protein YeaO, DUF488 family [Paraburkholderia megapolitana]